MYRFLRAPALDFLDNGADTRRACSLYLSTINPMRVKLVRFGDTEKRLRDVFA